ncbi:MAG: sigma-70 family RNA polymerase sigma factor [Anaerolineaceae bacterium]|nr:sigma-70 family RNA polymerase sigma factor [Anaerolineaceae bacterium]
MDSKESEWLSRSLKGDDEAFSHLVDMYQRPVFNLCYRMTGDAGDAEDAAQETFLRAYQNLRRYNPERSFATWLLSIAAHYCIDQLRRKRIDALPIDVLPEETIPDHLPNPETYATQTEEQRNMRALLEHLGPQDRAAIILRYWYDVPDEEIGAMLSLTVSAVKSRMHRARRELAHLWLEQQAQPVGSREEVP